VRSSREAAVDVADEPVGGARLALRSALVAAVVGLLIQTSVGRACGRGAPCTKRS
jgi:hypothetical protein